MRLVAGFLALPILLAAAPQEKVKLEWKWKKGETLRYEMTQSSTTPTGAGEMKQEQLFGMTMAVEEVGGDGAGSLKVTYDRVKILMSGMMETDYDSDRDKEPPTEGTGKLMSGFLGESVTMKMSTRGEVLEVKGFDALIEKVAKSAPEGQGDMMQQMMKQAYSDENMASMMQQGYTVLPKDPVAVGDSWESQGTFPMPMMGKMKVTTKCTLKEIRDGGKEAVIAQANKIEVDPEAENPMQGVLEVKDAAGTYEVIWSLERGAMTSMKGDMKMVMSAGGQEIKTTNTTEMKWAPKK